MQINVEKPLSLLGKRAKDVVTNLTGVITSISFGVSGCVQAFLQPPIKNDGTIPEGIVVDVSRIVIRDYGSAMTPPQFIYPVCPCHGPSEDRKEKEDECQDPDPFRWRPADMIKEVIELREQK
jgi:hypothetical protein